jgi:hypothetical protein
MSRIWRETIVEESNLQVQISALRKMLGEDRHFIWTIAGRGYQFVAEVAATPAEPHIRETTATQPMVSTAAPTNVPVPASDLIGRDAELADVAILLGTHRLVTLTGAGGIGKPRLGMEIARHALTRFPDGVWLAELGPLSDPDLVPVTVATALGLELPAGAVSPEHVAAALGSKQILMMLDNCEHVVDAVATMAEALLRGVPAIRVLATSREPLRADGEWIYRVPPLEVPEEGNDGIPPGYPFSLSLRVRGGETNPAAGPAPRPGAACQGRELGGRPQPQPSVKTSRYPRRTLSLRSPARESHHADRRTHHQDRDRDRGAGDGAGASRAGGCRGWCRGWCRCRGSRAGGRDHAATRFRAARTPWRHRSRALTQKAFPARHLSY